MKIKSEYFPHDYNSIDDEGIEILIDKYKAKGYGLYWYLIESLHKQDNNRIEIESKKFIYLVNKKIGVEEKEYKEILEFMIETCELLKSNKKEFWSDRVVTNIKKRKELSEKNSKNGKKSHKNKTEDWDEN